MHNIYVYNLLRKISTILQKSSTSKAALEITPMVRASGGHEFPFITSSVILYKTQTNTSIRN